jgi:hypothetical protein
MDTDRAGALFVARPYRERWIVVGEPFDVSCDVAPWRYYFAPIEDEL